MQLFVRPYIADEVQGIGLEITDYFEYYEDYAVMIQKNYDFTDGLYYKLEDTYGNCYMIIKENEILYPNGEMM